MTAGLPASFTIARDSRQLRAAGFGAGAPLLLIVPPLFDEMNRLRRTLVQAMRLLAADGLASLLLDLPGCGEDMTPFDRQNLTSWREAVRAAAAGFGATHILSVRGGALIDDGPGLPVTRLSPAQGPALLRAMLRTRIAGEREAGRTVTMEALRASGAAAALDLAGYRLSPGLVAELDGARPPDLPGLRTLAPGEGTIGGSPVWLRAEPGDDPLLAATLAADLAGWMRDAA